MFHIIDFKCLILSSLETILSSPVHKKKNKVTYSKFTTVSYYFQLYIYIYPTRGNALLPPLGLVLLPPTHPATTSTGALL